MHKGTDAPTDSNHSSEHLIELKNSPSHVLDPFARLTSLDRLKIAVKFGICFLDEWAAIGTTKS